MWQGKKHIELIKSYENQLVQACRDKKKSTRVRKYARYGKTSHTRVTKI